MIFESDNSKFNKKLIIEILIFIVEIVAVVFLAYAVVNYGLERTTVYKDSMSPTLVEDDSILIDKFSYRLSNPKDLMW